MAKEEVLEFAGVVKECLPDTRFLVELDETGMIINAYAAGKIRKNHIRILEGDRVVVEVTPYDLTKGRIKFRQK